MYKYTVIIFYLCLVYYSIPYAQPSAGITYVPDTSFTTYTAYQNIIKKYPYAKLVNDSAINFIIENHNVIYCTHSGKPLKIDVFSPPVNSNHIAIIFIHGGGWRSGNKEQHHPLARYLAASGYTCFTPAYRLSTDALYPAAIYDIKSAVKWVQAHAKEYAIDANKIIIAGFSAGGEIAAFVGNTINNPLFDDKFCMKGNTSVAAIIDIDGTLSFIHPESGEGDDSKKTSAATYWFGYSKKENHDLWEKASPLYYAGSHSIPTLFINSSISRMHAGRDDYIRILQRYNIYTEVKTFSDTPHTFCLFHPWFIPTIQCMDSFVKKILIDK